MKLALILVTLFSSFHWIDNSSKIQAPKPFEGIIVYEITSKSNVEGVSDEKIAEYVGTKLIKYRKGTKTISKTFNSSGVLIREALSLGDLGKSFFYSNQKDSIWWYPCSKEMDAFELISIDKKENKKILKYNCKTTSVKLKQLKEKPEYVVEYIYYCSKKFPKISEKDFCTDTVDQVLGAMILGWEVNGYPVCDRKFTPTSIKRQKLNDEIFKLSEDLPLKNI